MGGGGQTEKNRERKGLMLKGRKKIDEKCE